MTLPDGGVVVVAADVGHVRLRFPNGCRPRATPEGVHVGVDRPIAGHSRRGLGLRVTSILRRCATADVVQEFLSQLSRP